MNGIAEPGRLSARCAAASEASFLSLPHVEDLLRHAREIERTCPLLSLPLTQSREALSVLSRVQREAQLAELWSPALSLPSLPSLSALPSLPSLPSFSALSALPAASPLVRLRVGVLRALGVPPPPAGAGDAGVALGRAVVSAPGCGAPRHFAAAQCELSAAALAEWCEDIIFFAASRGFSAAQARGALLAAMYAMDAIASLPRGASDAAAERYCTAAIASVLVEHSCALPLRDGKESQSQLQWRRDGAVRCFSLAEIAEVLERVAVPALRHWRLLRAVLTEPQPVVAKTVRVAQMDIQPFCIPPLAEFLREDEYAMATQRTALAAEAEAAVAADFDALFATPLREMEAERDKLNTDWAAQEKQAEENNRLDALDCEQYGRVVRALGLRLDPLIDRHTGIAKEPDREQSPDTTPQQSTPPPKRHSSQRRRSTRTTLPAKSRAQANMESLASTPIPPVETVFLLDAVEKRVAKLEMAAQAIVDAAKERPKRK